MAVLGDARAMVRQLSVWVGATGSEPDSQVPALT
jgi:hypothetical protein